MLNWVRWRKRPHSESQKKIDSSAPPEKNPKATLPTKTEDESKSGQGGKGADPRLDKAYEDVLALSDDPPSLCQTPPVQDQCVPKSQPTLEDERCPLEHEAEEEKAVVDEDGCWGRFIPARSGPIVALRKDMERLGQAGRWAVDLRRPKGTERETKLWNLGPSLLRVGSLTLKATEATCLRDGGGLCLLHKDGEDEEEEELGRLFKSPGAAFPSAVIQAFQIGAELGRGSFGSVFNLTRRSDRRPAAIKVIRHSKTTEYRAKLFHREVETLKRVGTGGVHLIRCYAVYLWSETAFVVMEAAEGGDLASLLHRCREERLNESTTKLYAVQILRGLAYLHGRGYAHRDLKAENVLLMWPVNQADNLLKLCDFGLSKAVRLSEKSSGLNSIVGTTEYMAPEVIGGKGLNYSIACDIWSAGVLLFRSLSGDFPFSEPDIEAKILSRDIFRRRAVWDNLISGEAELLVEEMLTETPAHRPLLATLLQSAWFVDDERLERRLIRIGLQPLRLAKQATLHHYGFSQSRSN